MHRAALIFLLVILLTSFALTSCGGSNTAHELGGSDSVTPALSFQAAQSQLPSVQSLPVRRASTTLGIDAAAPAEIAGAPAHSSGVTIGYYTTATAPANAIEWVIYEVGPFSATLPPGQFVLNLVGSTGTVWLGMADFAQGAWDWQALTAPLANDMQALISSPGQHYRTSDGAAFLALVVYDGSTLRFGSGSASSIVPTELTAQFDFSIGPDDLPSGTTAVDNGVTLEIQPGSALWDPATHKLSFKVRLNNVGSHATSGCGGYDLTGNIGSPNSHITMLDANGNPINETFDPWLPDSIPEGGGTDWTTWEFENPNDVHFDFSVAIAWTAVHNLVSYCDWVDIGAGEYVSQIFLMQPDGTGAAQVTTFDYAPNFPGVDNGARDPAWSPNHAMIACISYEDLIIIDYNGDVTQLTFDGVPEFNDTGGMIKTERPKAEPCWSPDGRRICFIRRYDPNETSYELCVINTDGTGFTRLTNDINTNDDYSFPDHNPSWSPDGAAIFFDRQDETWVTGDHDIWRINPDGTGMTNITNSLDDYNKESYDGDPCISPDGQWVAFVSDREWKSVEYDLARYRSIYIMRPSGAAVTQVTTTSGSDEFRDYEPCWSPDGSRILFMRCWNNYSWTFCSIKPDGSGLQELGPTEYGGYPSW